MYDGTRTATFGSICLSGSPNSRRCVRLPAAIAGIVLGGDYNAGVGVIFEGSIPILNTPAPL
jgi:hypothetical protein